MFENIMEFLKNAFTDLLGEEKPPTNLEPIISELSAYLTFDFKELVNQHMETSRENPYVELRTEGSIEPGRTGIPLCRIFLTHTNEAPVAVSFDDRAKDHLEYALIKYARALRVDNYMLNGKKVYLVD